MVKRRAVSKEDKALQPDRLPLLYKTLVPLTADRHAGLFLSEDRDFAFAGRSNAIPLNVDEFPAALRTYPIVLAGGDVPSPVALVGAQAGQNDFVEASGAWKAQSYVPAYVRRYPFAFVRESETADRNILCADMSSVLLDNTGAPDRALFADDGAPASALQTILDFCGKYETALQRTRAAMEEARRLDLIQPSTVSISRAGKTTKVEGFQIISEEKLRALSDKDLADLARRGVLQIFTAHHLSLSNFTGFGESA